MLHNQLLKEITSYLMVFIEGEKDLDAYRINLFQNKGFDVVEAYKYLDID